MISVEAKTKQLRVARACMLTGAAWALLLVAANFGWNWLGAEGHQRISSWLDVAGPDLSRFFLLAVVLEKVASKCLRFAALFFWIRSRDAAS